MGEYGTSLDRNNGCIAKNNQVVDNMLELGINNVKIAPVCVDFEQLHKEYDKVDKSLLRKKWNIPSDARVVLYVGRFEKDKRPLDMVNIFNRLDNNFL